MKLATKLLLMTILFAAFTQNGIEATTNSEMNALYQQMFIELDKQSTMVFYAHAAAAGEPCWMPALSKLEMGRHIYAKIDLLEGILAELKAKRGQMKEEGEEYLLDENAVEMFLDFMKKRKGAAGHKAVRFSKFPRKKFVNKSEFAFIKDDEWWFMDELLGWTYPAEFFRILDLILLKMQLSPVDIDPVTRLPAKYRLFQIALIEFIEQLKFEIVVGQTQNDFGNLKERIQRSIIEIERKINQERKGIFSKTSHPQNYNQKPLFKKYKHLAEVSLEFYNVFESQIPENISKKAKKEETKLSKETMRLASKVEEAFGQVLPKTLASTTSAMSSTHSNDAIYELQRDLCLPTEWLEKQKELYTSSSGKETLISSIHMNTAMLLLAFERMAEFYHY